MQKACEFDLLIMLHLFHAFPRHILRPVLDVLQIGQLHLTQGLPQQSLARKAWDILGHFWCAKEPEEPKEPNLSDNLTIALLKVGDVWQTSYSWCRIRFGPQQTGPFPSFSHHQTKVQTISLSLSVSIYLPPVHFFKAFSPR